MSGCFVAWGGQSEMELRGHGVSFVQTDCQFLPKQAMAETKQSWLYAGNRGLILNQ